MSPEVTATIERVRQAYGTHCFACGPDNAAGLHIEFLDLSPDGSVLVRFEARPEFRGALDLLHGGIAATALDEVLVWAGILAEGVMTVTGTLDLRYRRPLTVGGHIAGTGRVLERSGRRLRIAGALTVDDRPAVEASGVYLATAEIAAL